MNNPMMPPPYSLSQCLERLGPTRRERYENLKALVADAAALQNVLQERYEAGDKRFRELMHRRQYYSGPGGNAEQVAKIDGELEMVRGKLEKLERERARRNGVRANTEQVVSRLDNF